MRDKFAQLANKVSLAVGSPWAFIVAVITLLLWAGSGPLIGFSDTWQLIINTGTTIITFLMVFLIQSTQNRETKAMNLKLDELIRATKKARNTMVDLEELSEKDLERLQKQFRKLTKRKTKVA